MNELDDNAAAALRAKLEEIEALEQEHAPYGVSFAMKGDPQDVVKSSNVADYIIAVIKHSAKLLANADSIRVPDLTPPV